LEKTIQEPRRKNLLSSLDIQAGPVLEIAPLYRPMVLKSDCEVYYCDCCDTNESSKKHNNYTHDQIVEIDFVWLPGTELSSASPISSFQTCVASHVLEHVPNPIGWLNSIFEVIPIGGVIALALPAKEYCFDLFRQDTSVAQLLDLWFRKPTLPTTLQIYDFLSKSVGTGFKNTPSDSIASCISECRRDYSNQQALEFSQHVWNNKAYLDCHCSVFSLETFPSIFNELVELGIINCRVDACFSCPETPSEFYVHLVKLGAPLVQPPELANGL